MMIYVYIVIYACAYRIVQNSGGENFGKFSETNIIRQCFTSQITDPKN